MWRSSTCTSPTSGLHSSVVANAHLKTAITHVYMDACRPTCDGVKCVTHLHCLVHHLHYVPARQKQSPLPATPPCRSPLQAGNLRGLGGGLRASGTCHTWYCMPSFFILDCYTVSSVNIPQHAKHDLRRCYPTHRVPCPFYAGAFSRHPKQAPLLLVPAQLMRWTL